MKRYRNLLLSLINEGMDEGKVGFQDIWEKINTIQDYLKIKDAKANESKEEKQISISQMTDTNDLVENEVMEFQMIRQPIDNLSNSKNTKNYQSEKINNTKNSKAKVKAKDEPYVTFAHMRKIKGNNPMHSYGIYRKNYENFLLQAEYMKDFVDDYKGEKLLPGYDAKSENKNFHSNVVISPLQASEIMALNYEDMDDEQLRTYFTWRTKVRQEDVKATSSSYAFCYIYELLNNIGIDSPSEGIEKLILIWNKFQKDDRFFDIYMKKWVRDYYVANYKMLVNDFKYYKDQFPVLEKDRVTDEEYKIVSSCSWDNIQLIEKSSSFRFTNGGFFKSLDTEDAAIIEQCVCYVFKSLKNPFKEYGVDMKRLFVSTMHEQIYQLFEGAIYNHRVNQDNSDSIKVSLSNGETMRKKNNRWVLDYLVLDKYKSAVGYILKLTEVKMREYFGFKKKLLMPEISPVVKCLFEGNGRYYSYIYPTASQLKTWKGKAYELLKSSEFEQLIQDFILKFCSENQIVVQGNKITKMKPIEIDRSKLGKLRDELTETANKLNTDAIVEEDNIVDEDDIKRVEQKAMNSMDQEPVKMQQLDGFSGFITELTQEESVLIKQLLSNQRITDIENIELIVESINEKALNFISDNMIELFDGEYSVYEEYQNELLNLLEVNK